MNKKIKEILDRNTEDWGDISLSQFKKDIDLLKQFIASQQSQIDLLKKLVKPKVNLNDPSIAESIKLDGKSVSKEDWEGVITFVRNLRKT